MQINIISFGFKHGPLPTTEIMFDVRFLPNPYYIPNLKETTGLAPNTAAYALENKAATDFFLYLLPLLDFLLCQYTAKERDTLTLGIGCTGGKHRSVAVAEALGKILSKGDHQTSLSHRDILKP